MIQRLTDIEIPLLVYKFRSWENKYHRRLLTHQELYFSKPSEFNDPFDGNIPVRWDTLSYEECLQRNLDLLNIVHKDKDQRLLIEYAKKVTDEKTLWHPDNLRKEPQADIDNWNSIIGLCSLSAIRDNILMWSHYSSNHTGYAVGLDTNSLIQNYDIDYLEPIDYQSDYPLIAAQDDTSARFYKKFFSKSEMWSYEKEWRLSKNHIENRKVKLNKNTIKEIIIGCNCSQGNASRIQKQAVRYLGQNIPIYKAIKLEGAFGLKFERIQ